MEGIVPAQIHQEEGATALQGQQIVLLMGVEIELPGVGLRVVGRTDRRAGMHHEIAGIGAGNGDVEEANGRGIAELLVRNQLEHRRATGRSIWAVLQLLGQRIAGGEGGGHR